MDKERVKQALHDKHGMLYSNDLSSIVDIILDAIELSREGEPLSIDACRQLTTGSLIKCQLCDGMVKVVSNEA